MLDPRFTISFFEREFTEFLAGFEHGKNSGSIGIGVYGNFLGTLAADDELKASRGVYTSNESSCGATSVGANLSRSNHLDIGDFF